MARKTDSSPQRLFNIAVVGLSGTEKEKGCMGVGKSCLCNRFIRPLADDYYTDHISVLSQTDFSGRIINNDHWLYWGETCKTSEEGVDLAFSIVEQTEFIDDACFQPFKSGKTDPYYKRCASVRLCSAEKMMYICKNQLGIEKEYEQKYLTDGRFCIDGYVCVFDVSEIQGRSIDKSIELTALILNNLIKTKKPIVFASTKHDEGNDYYVKEAERLVNRKEYKGCVPLVETSAHDNVNVDLAFIVCAQMIDRTKGKSKIMSYLESSRLRKDSLDMATEAYHSLIRSQVTDYRTLWNSVYKKLAHNHIFQHYCNMFGQEAAHITFKRHMRKLKDDDLYCKMQKYLRILHEVLNELLPDLESIGDDWDWTTVKERLKLHPDFHQYFLDDPEVSWQSIDLDDCDETRIPFDLMDTQEAEQLFIEHLLKIELDSDERRKDEDLNHHFNELIQETSYVNPGKSLSEVQLSLQLLSEGNALTDKLQSHFMTVSSSTHPEGSAFNPYFNEVNDRKQHLEMDDSDYSLERRTPIPPPVPSRQESCHIRSGSVEDGADSDGIYEQLPAEKSGDNGDVVSSSGFVDGTPLTPSDDSEVYASVFNQENGGEHLIKPSQIKNRRSLQTDLYQHSFPSTESLDRPLPGRPRDDVPHPPLPPRRDLGYAPPPYRAISPPPSYVSHFSPRLPPHNRPLHTSNPSSSLYSTGAYPDVKSYTPFHYHFHLKKSGSLKTSGTGHTGSSRLPGAGHSSHISRIVDDLEASDDISDEDDDDTVSSGLSGYGAYPPPPEPAPPDYQQKKTPALPRSVQRIYDEAEDGSSHEMLPGNSGWMDNRIYERGEDWFDNDVYHAYHGRHKIPPPLKPKPGKLNLKQFDNITDAIGRLNLSQSQGSTLPKLGLLHAPLATPESADLPPDYVKDSIYNSQDYYGMVHNSLPDGKHRIRPLARRTKDPHDKVGSDSDSEWSSLERRQRDPYSRVNRKPTPHKKVRKRRGIPVAPPRLPSFEGPTMPFATAHYPSSEHSSAQQQQQLAINPTVDSIEGVGNCRSDGSDMSNEEERTGDVPLQQETRLKTKPKRSFHLKRRLKMPSHSHSVPETNFSESQSPPGTSVATDHAVTSYSIESSSKLKIDSSLSCIQPAHEDDYDPRDATIRQLGKVLKSKSATAVTESNDKITRKERDRKKAREEEKLEKRRLKEEERLKRLTEKKKKKQSKANSTHDGPGLEDFAQSEDKPVPLFVEKCIQFIEEEGLDSEGIYRVPGNRAHVDLLVQKFEEDPNVSIRELDIPVNAVATALKDFFSKRLPPLIPSSMMDELTDVSSMQDKHCRLMAFKELFENLPKVNFEVTKYVFQHFVKVTENYRLNSMDSKNLAICWWPTLLPFEFNDMVMFERMRPHLEDSIQTMIDQFKFLFCDDEEILMV